MYTQFLAHLLQSGVVKLHSIVGHDGMWDTKSVDYVLPNEACAFRLSDGGQGLSFDPFGEIIDHDYSEPCLSTGHRQRSDQIYTPFREWPKIDNGGQWFGRLSWNVGKPLALITLLNKFSRILLHGRTTVQEAVLECGQTLFFQSGCHKLLHGFPSLHNQLHLVGGISGRAWCSLVDTASH